MTYADIVKHLKKLPGIVYGLVLIIAFFGLTADYFLTFMNLMNILKHASVLIVVSLGTTLDAESIF